MTRHLWAGLETPSYNRRERMCRLQRWGNRWVVCWGKERESRPALHGSACSVCLCFHPRDTPSVKSRQESCQLHVDVLPLTHVRPCSSDNTVLQLTFYGRVAILAGKRWYSLAVDQYSSPHPTLILKCRHQSYLNSRITLFLRQIIPTNSVMIMIIKNAKQNSLNVAHPPNHYHFKSCTCSWESVGFSNGTVVHNGLHHHNGNVHNICICNHFTFFPIRPQ